MKSPVVATLALLLLACRVEAQERTPPVPPPTFRSGVALVTVDVSALDQDWAPVPGLTVDDFEVELAGNPRPVRALDYLTFGSGTAAFSINSSSAAATRPAVPPRTFLLLVDDLSFPFGSGKALVAAAERFIGTLPATDLVGVATSSGRQSVRPSTERPNAITALRGAVGAYQAPYDAADAGAQVLELEMSIDEALRIDRHDSGLTTEVAQRECGEAPECRTSIVALARDMTWEVERTLARQARSWTAQVEELARMAGPRMLVIISRGVLLEAAPSLFSEFARRSVASGIRVHVLAEAADATDATKGSLLARPRSSGRGNLARANEEARLLRNGLEDLAGGTGGTFQQVIGAPERHFTNIVRASAAFYRLGVEIPAGTKPGAALKAQVKVRRRGVTIRAGREVIAPGPPIILTTEEQLHAAVADGRVFLALPLTVRTMLRRDPSGERLELGLHCEVASTDSRPLDVIYSVIGQNGQVLRSQRGRLEAPSTGGQRHFSIAVPVLPGEYRIRIAAADALGAVGSLEQPVTARLGRLGPYLVSDVLAKWITASGEPSLLSSERLPDAAAAVEVGLEVYAAGAMASGISPRATLSVSQAQGVVVTAEATPIEIKGGWFIGGRVPIEQFEPDTYTVAVNLFEAEREAGTRSTVMVKASPAVIALPTSEAVLRILQQDAAAAIEPVHVAALLQPRLVETQLAAVAARASEQLPALAAAQLDDEFWQQLTSIARSRQTATGRFASGLLALKGGDPGTAHRDLESALELVPDSAAVMLYLGTTFAAAGHDRDAVGPWQLVLADPLATPVWQIEQANALVRLGDLSEAAEVLADASRRWPTESQIAIRQGEILIAGGQFDAGRRVLDGVLAQSPDDQRVLFLVTAHAFAHALAGNRVGDDVARFNLIADRYLHLNPTHAALVENWKRLLAANQPK